MFVYFHITYFLLKFQMSQMRCCSQGYKPLFSALNNSEPNLLSIYLVLNVFTYHGTTGLAKFDIS